MVGAGTYCGKGGVGGLRGAERDGREGREGREGRVGGERAGEGQESKEKIGRLTFSLGAAPQGGRRICIYIYMYICVYIHTCISKIVCIYIYTHMDRYIHKFVYIYICYPPPPHVPSHVAVQGTKLLRSTCIFALKG